LKSIKHKTDLVKRKNHNLKSVAELKAWLNLYPFDYPALSSLILNLELQGCNKESKIYLKKIDIDKLLDSKTCLELALHAYRLFEDALAFQFMLKSVSLEPGSIEKWNRLAEQVKSFGRIDQAKDIFINLCKSELANDNVKAQAYFNLGLLAQENYHSDLSIIAYQKALEFDPGMINASMNLGNVLSQVNRLDEALKIFTLALHHDPDYSLLYFNKALVLDKLGHLDESILTLQMALRLEPGNTHFLRALGAAYLEIKDYESALQYCDKVLANNAYDIQSLINKGIALQRTFESNQAVSTLNLALIFEPANEECLINLGNVHKDLGDAKKARVIFENTLNINPQNTKAKLNLGLIELQMAEFTKGWANYEWRWLSPDFVSRKLDIKLPLWSGSSNAQHLLLWAEQGVGDEVMFGSLIKETQLHVAQTSVLMDKRLIALFERSLPGIRFYDQSKGIPEVPFDVHCPLGSLPRILRSHLESFTSHQSSYLLAENDKVASFRKMLAPNGQKIIGLSWFSNSDATGLFRSINLNLLIESIASAFNLKTVTLVCLQYGDVKQDIRSCWDSLGITVQVIQDVDRFNDLNGMANLISACDLVISVDNSTVMLSTALGKETKVLLPLNSDWRWGTKDIHSLWFPNVDVYRKEGLTDWTSALKKLAIDLSKG
jgi:tetratricopeptide (TPR) repeat protein